MPARAQLETIRLDQARLIPVLPKFDSVLHEVEQAVQLPNAWNNSSPMQSGVYEYRISIELSDIQAQQLNSLYIPRAGNRFMVIINQHTLLQVGELNNPHEDYAQRPHLSRIPSDMLKIGRNQISIFVAGEKNRYAGLSRVYLGQYSQLKPIFESRKFLQNLASWIIILACFSIGAMALLIAYISKNKILGFFGIGSIAWALRTTFLIAYYVPLQYQWLLFFFDFTLCLSMVCLLYSAIHASKIYRAWFDRVLIIYFIISTIATALFALGYPYIRGFNLLSMLLVVIFVFYWYISQIIRSPRKHQKLLTLAFIIAIGFGTYDHFMVHRSAFGYELFSYSKFSFIFAAVALSYIFGTRLLATNALITKQHQRTQTKLLNTRRALENVHQQQIISEKQQAIQQERWRFMQDMHDGLGSHLMGLQKAVLEPGIQPGDLAAQVQEAQNELRMTVNALTQGYTYVDHMLGALRDRLERMCVQRGKTLSWAVCETPDTQNISELHIATLEKMVLEIFNNIAKHSNATQVSLTLAHDTLPDTKTDLLRLTIEENGSGFSQLEPSIVSGKGIAGLRARAKQIGATMLISQNGCCVSIQLPTLHAH